MRQYLLNPEAEAIPFGFAYLSDLVEGRSKDRIFIPKEKAAEFTGFMMEKFLHS
ncbi:hypothetical protein [Rugamonas apoptosis]|uniref:Uncharacterized protein n=1 Tax=Rugamonas apoptosis TaxID=2758570 RepID=A0A7W2FDP3_9BURK|nr:hypothetical protein [Rugamonas apoptosis]MBA5689815.1 hypothetical protein [Rugamonas apoptosis]